MKTILTLLLISLNSNALSIYPLTQQFKLKNELSKIYEIKNDTKENIAIEVTVESRIHKNGKEINESSNKINQDFKIFPKSLILTPNEMKAIRVSYVGDKNIDIEKSYRVIFSEKLIKDKKSQNFRALMEFRTSAFISPEKSSSKVEINNLKIEGNLIKFQVSNRGNEHQSFEKAILKIKDDKEEYTFSSKEYNPLMINLLANETRAIEIPKPIKLNKIKSSELSY